MLCVTWFFFGILSLVCYIFYQNRKHAAKAEVIQATRNCLTCGKNCSTVQAKEHAIVIGGGMAGFSAAKALSAYFRKVTIVEKTPLPEGSARDQAAKGRPQAKQGHGLLLAGQATMDHYFPCFTKEMLENGANELNWTYEAQWRLHGQMSTPSTPSQRPVSLCTVTASRPFIDYHMLRRVKEVDNIEIIENAAAKSLIMEQNVCRGVVVRVKSKTEGSSTSSYSELQLKGDFVVNASGSKGPTEQLIKEALAKMTDAPTKIEKEVINAHSRYLTAFIRKPDHINKEFGMHYCGTVFKDDIRKGCLIYPIENGNFFITIWGYGKDCYPPSLANLSEEDQRAALINYLDDTPNMATVQSVIRDWHIVSPYLPRMLEVQSFLRLEKLPVWPENFVTLGAAIVNFDPAYGQGMTHALLCTRQMDNMLRKRMQSYPLGDFCGLGKEIQSALATLSQDFWDLPTNENLQRPTTEGNNTFMNKALAYYAMFAVQHMLASADLTHQFFRVAHMLDPPTVLFSPKVLFPTLAKLIPYAFEQLKNKKKDSSTNNNTNVADNGTKKAQ